MCSAQNVGPREDVSTFNPDFGPECPQPFEVQVDWPMPDVAAAGKRDTRAAAATEHRSQHADAGSHPADQFVIGEARLIVGHGQCECPARATFNRHAERSQHLRQRGNIDEFRHAVQHGRPCCRKRRGHDRQRRVLGSAHRHRTTQRLSASNHQHVHPWTLSQKVGVASQASRLIGRYWISEAPPRQDKSAKSGVRQEDVAVATPFDRCRSRMRMAHFILTRSVSEDVCCILAYASG